MLHTDTHTDTHTETDRQTHTQTHTHRHTLVLFVLINRKCYKCVYIYRQTCTNIKTDTDIPCLHRLLLRRRRHRRLLLLCPNKPKMIQVCVYIQTDMYKH